MDEPKNNATTSPKLDIVDRQPQKIRNELRARSQAEAQLAIQLELRRKRKQDMLSGITVGLAISMAALGIMTLICLAVKFYFPVTF